MIGAKGRDKNQPPEAARIRMTTSRHDLLKPTLDSSAPAPIAPYSVQTMFLVAFFGGPLAALGITGLNSYRLRRFSRDLPWLATLAVIAMALSWFVLISSTGLPARDWISEVIGANGRRLVSRLFALLLVGLGFVLHRREQRNADLLGIQRPNGWIGGTICLVAGGVAFALILIALQRVGS
jgi:hypothetical protein